MSWPYSPHSRYDAGHMKIAVYGLGRFGTFWADLIQALGEIHGYNRSPKQLSEGIRPIQVPDLRQMDAVFLCSAISSMPQVCEQIAPYLRPGSIVFDTCSVKVFPSRIMAERLPQGVRIIPLHPMFGPDSANREGHRLPLVLCPDPRSDDNQAGYLDQWEQRFASLGMDVVRMSPEEHDQEAARTQGVTHFVGRLLSGLELRPSPIGTLGYRKIFEVMEQTCHDPWQLFLDLQRFNPYTAPVRQDLERSFRHLMEELSTLTDETGG